MKFEDSKYSEEIPYVKKEFPFGNLYITKQFILSELNEGVHVDHHIASELVSLYLKNLPSGRKVGYIANRLNSYSFDPQLWVEFNDEYDFLVACAIVSYSNFSYLSASLEKQFFSKSLKRCRSLEEAIEWMLNLKEFKKEFSQN
ncbi:hypothetical protein DFQ11_102449 [Winogradskyella epiphytica]|uniref:SpoIIAA-like protein n=1 Tax=Winogradskyella epiphytica TaxID=262005 RepID=A0A2V4XU28_9FLAO|nr:hypothetical protein [Winogradskyella epiphytica]PYE81871.1 hypothetical protein DFQ11_102449 [Winogradskyella epiphytica]GGW62072.1 hypothetical protein GCM10008085_12220 [Winogradskyella epiphytica]